MARGLKKSLGARRVLCTTLPEVGMRQVVVLEPAGNVLLIRQTSLGGGNGTNGGVSVGSVTGITTTNNSVGSGLNHHNVHETHASALTNNAVTTALASSDHNQNRIVVVRSSSSSCMTSSVSTYVAVTLFNCGLHNSRRCRLRMCSVYSILEKRTHFECGRSRG